MYVNSLTLSFMSICTLMSLFLIIYVILHKWIYLPIKRLKQAKIKEIQAKEKRLKKIEDKLIYLDTLYTSIDLQYKDLIKSNKKVGVK